MFSWTRPGLLAHPWGRGVAYASPKPQGLIGWWGAERAKEGKWFYKREPWCFCQNRGDGTLGRKTWPSRFFHKPPPRRRLACLCHMVACPSWRCRPLIGDFLGHPFVVTQQFLPFSFCSRYDNETEEWRSSPSSQQIFPCPLPSSASCHSLITQRVMAAARSGSVGTQLFFSLTLGTCLITASTLSLAHSTFSISAPSKEMQRQLLSTP